MTGIPCSHAICAIQKAYQQPHDFVHDFFKKSMYLETYNHAIYPVPSQEQWTRTDTHDKDPPVFKVEKGRVQTKRRRGKFEVPQSRETSRMATITCSNCKLLGHRYTNCTKTLQPHLQMRKNQHQVLYIFLYIFLLISCFNSCLFPDMYSCLFHDLSITLNLLKDFLVELI